MKKLRNAKKIFCRTFKLNKGDDGTIFTINEHNKKSVLITWYDNNVKQEVTYFKSDAIEYVNKGSWILQPELNK